MSARKHRIRVVLDTNVLVRNFKSRSQSSPNRKIVRLWLVEKRLQLIVSSATVAEYLGIFDEILGMEPDVVEQWRERFDSDARVTLVNLARRDDASRDPDDNVFLSTARAGRAKHLITNDRDLLDLPEAVQHGYAFSIINPDEFLAILDKEE